MSESTHSHDDDDPLPCGSECPVPSCPYECGRPKDHGGDHICGNNHHWVVAFSPPGDKLRVIYKKPAKS